MLLLAAGKLAEIPTHSPRPCEQGAIARASRCEFAPRCRGVAIAPLHRPRVDGCRWKSALRGCHAVRACARRSSRRLPIDGVTTARPDHSTEKKPLQASAFDVSADRGCQGPSTTFQPRMATSG